MNRLNAIREQLRELIAKISTIDAATVERDIKARRLDVMVAKKYLAATATLKIDDTKDFCRSLGPGQSYQQMRLRIRVMRGWDIYLERRRALADCGRYGLELAHELVSATSSGNQEFGSKAMLSDQPMDVRFLYGPSFSGRCGLKQSNSGERTTPPDIFKKFAADSTLDVAATKANALCPKFFTKRDSALKKVWPQGHVVWCNPPYNMIPEFLRRCVEYAEAGGVARALLPAWTDCHWFHDLCPLGKVTFIRRRLKFGGMAGASPFASIVVEFNPQTIAAAKQRPAGDRSLVVYLDDDLTPALKSKRIT